jgi:hypothetical protein
MTTTAGDNTAPAAARHGSVARSVLLHAAGTLLALVLLPLCLLAGVPFAAWAIAFALVVGNRLVQGIVGWAVRDSSLTVQLGSHGFSMIFRALFTAMTLFLVGASVGASGDRPVGLDRPDLAKPALLIFILCFTLDAGIEAIRRAGDREELLAMEMMTASTTVQEHPA